MCAKGPKQPIVKTHLKKEQLNYHIFLIELYKKIMDSDNNGINRSKTQLYL